MVMELWQKVSERGLAMPLFYDPVTDQASVTLMFAYLSFILAAASVIALHFKPELLIPTIVTLSFWGVSVLFYLIRRITKAKVDFASKSFELDNGAAESESDPATPKREVKTSANKPEDVIGS